MRTKYDLEKEVWFVWWLDADGYEQQGEADTKAEAIRLAKED